jgi:cytochrome c553
MNTPNLGVSSEDPGKYVLGTVLVEEDGSAWCRIPSGIPVFFQALDADGLAVQTMRTLTYVQPQQTLSCMGCHESRERAPAVEKYPLALSRQPSRLTPGPEGSWPLRFDVLVQPVLDRNCVSCHGPAGGDKPAARFDLTAAQSYRNLLSFGGNDLRNLSYERDRSVVGTSPARQSKLWSILTAEKPHGGERLDSESRRRLATWMDVYAQAQGHFSKEQEDQLRQLRRDYATLLSD